MSSVGVALIFLLGILGFVLKRCFTTHHGFVYLCRALSPVYYTESCLSVNSAVEMTDNCKTMFMSKSYQSEFHDKLDKHFFLLFHWKTLFFIPSTFVSSLQFNLSPFHPRSSLPTRRRCHHRPCCHRLRSSSHCRYPAKSTMAYFRQASSSNRIYPNRSYESRRE